MWIFNKNTSLHEKCLNKKLMIYLWACEFENNQHSWISGITLRAGTMFKRIINVNDNVEYTNVEINCKERYKSLKKAKKASEKLAKKIFKKIKKEI